MSGATPNRLGVGFPGTAPLLDAKSGVLSPVWLRFLQTLWGRSGGAAGVDVTALAGLVTSAQQAAADAQGSADVAAIDAAVATDLVTQWVMDAPAPIPPNNDAALIALLSE